MRNRQSQKNITKGVLYDVTWMNKTSSSVKGILTNDAIKGPKGYSYKTLDPKLKKLHDLNPHLVFCEMMRDILENKANEQNNMPKEIITLTACLFIAEAGRNPSTYLTSLMLLDLIQKGVNGWNQNSMISQESSLDKAEHDPFGVITRIGGDFRGMHPMTHDGSYIQSTNICAITLEMRKKLLSLVEYKSAIIIGDWLQLTCDIKSIEKVFKNKWDVEVQARFLARPPKTGLIDQDLDIHYCTIVDDFPKREGDDLQQDNELSDSATSLPNSIHDNNSQTTILGDNEHINDHFN